MEGKSMICKWCNKDLHPCAFGFIGNRRRRSDICRKCFAKANEKKGPVIGPDWSVYDELKAKKDRYGEPVMGIQPNSKQPVRIDDSRSPDEVYQSSRRRLGA